VSSPLSKRANGDGVGARAREIAVIDSDFDELDQSRVAAERSIPDQKEKNFRREFDKFCFSFIRPAVEEVVAVAA